MINSAVKEDYWQVGILSKSRLWFNSAQHSHSLTSPSSGVGERIRGVKVRKLIG